MYMCVQYEYRTLAPPLIGLKLCDSLYIAESASSGAFSGRVMEECGN